MTAFAHLRRRRHRIARLMLAVFVVTWAALAWQPCVHAFDGMQKNPPTAQQIKHCPHCPPQATADEHPATCRDSVTTISADFDHSPVDGRPVVKLLLPPVILAQVGLDSPLLDVRRAILLPILGQTSRHASRRPLNLIYGVLLN